MAHRIGILGLGSMGERMARSMRQHAGFAVVAACDPDPGAAAKLARLAPQARLVADAAELAADPAVDCLYIAAPPARHLAHARLAFDRGKAVFCEKPLATDLALAQAAVDRAEREHRVAAVNFPFASAPAVRALASGLRSGELGGIEHVDIEVAFARWPRPQQETAHWLGRCEEGGFVREVLSHFIFLTQRLIGPVQILDSRVDYPEDGQSAETGITAHLVAGTVRVSLAGRVGGDAPDFNHLQTPARRPERLFYISCE